MVIALQKWDATFQICMLLFILWKGVFFVYKRNEAIIEAKRCCN